MSTLLPIHIAFAGIWLGCVLTEALFERALLGKGNQAELILVDLHKCVDLLIEIPAFIAVLVTGLMIYPPAAMSTLLDVKIGFGLLAIVTNIYCVWLVFRRAAAAKQGNSEEFARLDHKQHIYGTIALLAIIVALIIGISLHG